MKLSRGEIVDYTIGSSGELGFQVDFEYSNIKPVSVSESELIAAGVSLGIRKRIIALINTNATEERQVNPRKISPLGIKDTSGSI